MRFGLTRCIADGVWPLGPALRVTDRIETDEMNGTDLLVSIYLGEDSWLTFDDQAVIRIGLAPLLGCIRLSKGDTT